MFCIDVRSEVRTRHVLPDALRSGKRIVVPYCAEGELQLFLLQDMGELRIGLYKIREPRPEVRSLLVRRVTPAEFDLVMVLGVAFDRS